MVTKINLMITKNNFTLTHQLIRSCDNFFRLKDFTDLKNNVIPNRVTFQADYKIKPFS